MKASLYNYRQAPRKVRLVTDLIRGKDVVRAAAELQHLPKRASGPIAKLLASAVANAGQNNNVTDNLYIKTIRVDKGIILKRSMPRAMGRAFPIHKHSSHVMLELGVRGEALPKGKGSSANRSRAGKAEVMSDKSEEKSEVKAAPKPRAKRTPKTAKEVKS